MKKISICIATYNGEKYIKQQLDSILCQIGEDDEVIISDDNSTDKTLDIIKNYNDKRIRVSINNERMGCIANFENTLNNSSGEYIFLADQDDVWLPNKVGYILKNISPQQLVISDAWICDEKLHIIKRLSEWREYKKGYLTNLYKSCYLGCTMAFTRSMLDFFLPIPKNIKGHDVWFGLLSELKYKIIYIDEPLMYYRRHNQAHSTSGNKSKNSLQFMIKYRFYFLYHTLKRYISS